MKRVTHWIFVAFRSGAIFSFFAVVCAYVQITDQRRHPELANEDTSSPSQLSISTNTASNSRLGPFLPQPVLTLYIIAHGKPAWARLIIHIGEKKVPERLMVRVLNPDERLVLWQYAEPNESVQLININTQNYFPLNIRNNSQPGDLVLDTTVQLNNHGVYQIRIVAGSRNSQVNVELSRPLPYGVSFQNGRFTAWKDQPPIMYAYVPPRAEELELAGGPIQIHDTQGRKLVSTTSSNLKERINIHVSETKTVWKVSFSRVSAWTMRTAGFPFILCSTPDAAWTLQASVEELPDGTVVSHKFQRRIAELLPKLLAPEKVGHSEKLFTSLISRKEEWLKNPVRNFNLLNPYGLMPEVQWALLNQNLNPDNHWGGAIGGWQSRINLPPPGNRWDRLKSMGGLWAGVSPRHTAAQNLAQAALLDAPLNPYFGKRELLNRAAASALRDLMALGEDEIWRGVDADMEDYPGFIAFTLGQKTLPVYSLVAPHMPKEIREVWTEGVRHLIDRTFPEYLLSARNQSAHFLLAYEDFAIGSGIPGYKKLARMYAQRFIQGVNRAGYFMEQQGPDGSYTGITHWFMANYYRKSGDQVVLEALRRSYQFWNHTVAPEPDGIMLGGFNFNHRVGEGFYHEQWGGAKGILDDILPEVGLWAIDKPTSANQIITKYKVANEVVQLLRHLPSPAQESNINTPRYLYWHEPDRTGVWPALEDSSFIRDFAGELIAVKRPAYYLTIYVGHPAPIEHYISGREDFRFPLETNIQSKGVKEPNLRKVTPFLGGGLSMFWTPSYGSVFIAANWSPLTHHGLIVTDLNNKRYWEDYFSTNYRLNHDSNTLRITGRIENQPIMFSREYKFLQDQVEVSLQLTSKKDIQLSHVFENLPILQGPIKSQGVLIGNKYMHNIIKESATQIVTDKLFIVDTKGKGLEVTFDHPQSLLIRLDEMGYRNIQLGSAQIMLPKNLTRNTIGIRYSLKPIS
jgi:hypothetical protein